MFTGWLAVGGVEVINDARAVTYARALGIPGIKRIPPATLVAALGDAAYTTPTADDAPWYDPVVPASARFAGIIGLSILGGGSTPRTRVMTPRLGDGSSASAPRYGHRELAVTALLVGADEQALSYGVAWLASALRGDLCQDNVDGDNVCLFTATPTCPGDALVCGDAEQRTLFRSTVFDGPRVVSTRKISVPTCAPGQQPAVAEVEFNIAATHPFLYRAPVDIAAEVGFVFPEPSATCSINWIPVGSGACPGLIPCAPGDDCMTDPLAPPLPYIPTVPVRVDPADCTTAIDKAAATITVPPGVMPGWLDVVPIITISTGGQNMRRIAIRFAGHSTPEPCSEILTGRCAACAEIRIPFLPLGSTFTLDGRTERAWVDCPYAGEGAANPQLFGADGEPVEWPVVDCGGSLCIQVTAEADHTSVDATVTVQLVAREDAA